MKKALALLALISFVLTGCAGTPKTTSPILNTPEGKDCIRDCQFRNSLCTSACERKRGMKAPGNYYGRRFQNDFDICMDECRRKLQDCYNACLSQKQNSSD
jgi:hypothetical protein